MSRSMVPLVLMLVSSRLLYYCIGTGSHFVPAVLLVHDFPEIGMH